MNDVMCDDSEAGDRVEDKSLRIDFYPLNF